MFSLFSIFSDIIFFLGFVGQNKAFPPPLSKEEEAKLLARLEKGDDEAREKLIVHNLRLCAHIAKKYIYQGKDIEDITSIGTIGLIKAVNTFSRERGSLVGYASCCIENEIRMVFRAERKLVAEVPLDEPIKKDKDGNDMTLADTLITDEQSVFDLAQGNIEKERIYKLMEKHLTLRERTVMVYRIGFNGGVPLTQREVAKLLGISRSYVSRIETKSIAKLKKALQGEREML
jgi:RNA polymerase sporulation-specific sigma factor